MRPDDVQTRREKLRLSVAELARMADLDKHTIHRIEAGLHSPVSATLDKISNALIAEERRVLAHLLALHPAQSSGLATSALAGGVPASVPAVASPSAAGTVYRNGVHP